MGRDRLYGDSRRSADAGTDSPTSPELAAESSIDLRAWAGHELRQALNRAEEFAEAFLKNHPRQHRKALATAIREAHEVLASEQLQEEQAHVLRLRLEILALEQRAVCRHSWRIENSAILPETLALVSDYDSFEEDFKSAILPRIKHTGGFLKFVTIKERVTALLTTSALGERQNPPGLTAAAAPAFEEKTLSLSPSMVFYSATETRKRHGKLSDTPIISSSQKSLRRTQFIPAWNARPVPQMIAGLLRRLAAGWSRVQAGLLTYAAKEKKSSDKRKNLVPEAASSELWARDETEKSEAYVTTLVGPHLIRLARKTPPLDTADLDCLADLHLTAIFPKVMEPGMWGRIILYAHWGHDVDEVRQYARQARGLEGRGFESKSNSAGPLGRHIRAHLTMERIEVRKPSCRLRWSEQLASGEFEIKVPSDATSGRRRGKIIFEWQEHNLPKLDFFVDAIQITEDSLRERSGSDPERKAFASYSREDKKDVLPCVYGMRGAVPELEIFIDQVDLRGGCNFLKIICERIVVSETFFLFWSANAQRSDWVKEELSFAINVAAKKGIARDRFIRIMPLEFPIDPPEGFDHINVDDPMLKLLSLLRHQKSGSVRQKAPQMFHETFTSSYQVTYQIT